MKLTPKLKSLSNLFRVQTHRYGIWELDIRGSEPRLDALDAKETADYVVRELTRDDTDIIAASRPGYEQRAVTYFDEGHRCFAAINELGEVAALSWLFANSGPETRRVKRYFDVASGEGYLHAAWTHPSHRRKGLHTMLLKERVKILSCDPSLHTAVANIEPGLAASEQSFRKAGFVLARWLTVRHFFGGRKSRSHFLPLEAHETGSPKVIAHESPSILILDGDYSHTVAIARELDETLGARISTVSRGDNTLGARSRHVRRNFVFPHPRESEYSTKLLDLLQQERFDVVVPVGYHSTKRVVDLLESGALKTPAVAPDVSSFEFAEDKRETLTRAQELGIQVPEDYTASIRENGAEAAYAFPLIAKAQHERGGSTAFVIENLDELKSHMAQRVDVPYIYQELVNPSSPTLAHCGLFVDGEPIVEFQHAEVRSVPRIGGSGTRLISVRNTELRDQARAILRAQRWTGIAQVEFKVASNGTLVLMEINPKLWASYALATRSGAHLATAAVQRALGEQVAQSAQYRPTTMAFPLREIQYICRRKAWRDLPGAFVAIFRPGTHWDLELLDIKGYIQRL